MHNHKILGQPSQLKSFIYSFKENRTKEIECLILTKNINTIVIPQKFKKQCNVKHVLKTSFMANFKSV